MREFPHIPLARVAWRMLFVFGLFMPTAGAAAQDEPNTPDRWAEAMARFEELDAKNPPEPGGTIFVGSSSIRLWDLEESFPNWNATNRGFGGSQMADSVRHIELLVLRHRPSRVVVYAGDNDIWAGKSPRQVRDDFLAFKKALHMALPKTGIFYIAIKPSSARWSKAGQMRKANDLIKAACEKRDHCTFVDIWEPMLGDDGKPRKELLQDDELHMKPAGYAVWTREIHKAIKRANAESSRNAPD